MHRPMFHYMRLSWLCVRGKKTGFTIVQKQSTKSLASCSTWPDYTCYTRSRSLRWPTDLRKHTVRRWNRVVCWQRQQSRWRVYSVNEYFQTIQEIPKPPQILAKCKYFYSFDDPLSRRHWEWERNRRSSRIHWFELIACFCQWISDAVSQPVVTEAVIQWSLSQSVSQWSITEASATQRPSPSTVNPSAE